MQICIVQMGGTIDKVYPQEPNAYGFEIQDAKAMEILNRWGNQVEYEYHTIARKDSQDLTAEDSESLLSFISSHSFGAFLITHGTVTMVETASYLGKLNIDKTIVLVGAFILGTEKDTDAPANLDFAIAAAQRLEKGVYIAMNGKVFRWNNVKKNVTKNRFEENMD